METMSFFFVLMSKIILIPLFIVGLVMTLQLLFSAAAVRRKLKYPQASAADRAEAQRMIPLYRKSIMQLTALMFFCVLGMVMIRY